MAAAASTTVAVKRSRIWVCSAAFASCWAFRSARAAFEDGVDLTALGVGGVDDVEHVLQNRGPSCPCQATMFRATAHRPGAMALGLGTHGSGGENQCQRAGTEESTRTGPCHCFTIKRGWGEGMVAPLCERIAGRW